MTGLSIDWPTRVTRPPAWMPNSARHGESFLLRSDPQTGRMAAYRRKWLGKIVDR
jgi:hypothetical protein